MSTNLDLVRSIYADWERGDFSRADWADPEIEFAIADGPAPGSWVGRQQMARAWRDVLAVWGNWQVLVEEFRELDRERVLVLVAASARGKTSGISIDAMRGSETGANLFQIRSGRVTRLVVYFMSDRAFADLGLAPEGKSLENRDASQQRGS